MTKTTLFAFLALTILSIPFASAQTLSIAGGGNISMDFAQSEITPQYILYTTAHLTTQSGTTLDADQIKALIGTGDHLTRAIATGNVKAFVNDAVNKRKYTVTADMAIFDPNANTIVLTGNVKLVILSPYTDGPITQTGTSATIQLGKGPDYPQIVMRQGHTQFSVKQ